MKIFLLIITLVIAFLVFDFINVQNKAINKQTKSSSQVDSNTTLSSSSSFKTNQQNVSIPTPTPIRNSLNWRVIKRQNWQFEVPDNWKYSECNSNLIFISPVVKEDETNVCGGAVFGNSFQILKIDLSKNETFDPFSPYNKEIAVTNLIIDNEKAKRWVEYIEDREGAGSYEKISIPSKSVIISSYANYGSKEVFDHVTFNRFIQSIKFNY